ncbi:hypothetical protein Hanom_Chr06g00564401 [Helianthus anomalus]
MEHQAWSREPKVFIGGLFESWEWHMSPRVRTWHGEVTAEQAWSGSDSRSEITPAVGRTVHLPPPPPHIYITLYNVNIHETYTIFIPFLVIDHSTTYNVKEERDSSPKTGMCSNKRRLVG